MEQEAKKLHMVECLMCQTKFYVQPPTVRVMNAPESSVIVLTHERPEQCTGCRQLYVCTVAGLDGGVKLTWVPFKDFAQQAQARPEASTAIVPPSARDIAAVNPAKANLVFGPDRKLQ